MSTTQKRLRLTGGRRSRSKGESSKQLSSRLGALRLDVLLLRGSCSANGYGSGRSHVVKSCKGGTRWSRWGKVRERGRSLTVKGLESTIGGDYEVAGCGLSCCEVKGGERKERNDLVVEPKIGNQLPPVQFREVECRVSLAPRRANIKREDRNKKPENVKRK